MPHVECTAGELAEMARVPRQLVLRHEDRDTADAWIAGIPLDYSGYVWLDRPDYLVEVQAVMEEEDSEENVEANRFLVSIDDDITVVVCEVLHLSFFIVSFTLVHNLVLSAIFITFYAYPIDNF